MKATHISLPLLLLISLFAACGGGGGGGDGGDGAAGRTTSTAVRLIHGAVAVAPLQVIIGEQLVSEDAYAQSSNFVQVPSGPAEIILRRAKSTDGSFRTLAANLEPETEYSLFLFGGIKDGSDEVKLIEEPVTRPEEGFARVRVLNALAGSSGLRLSGTSLQSNGVSAVFGASSGFVESLSGPVSITVSSNNGVPLSTLAVNLADRGELTILISGSSDVGFVTTTLFEDLD